MTIKASTPEECRQAIVAWLKKQAIAYGSSARLTEKKTKKKELTVKSDAYLFAANCIATMSIENNKPDFSVDYISNFDYSKTVDEWIKEGWMLHAIKKRRSDTNEGLKEAKDYCEKRRAELGFV